MPINTRLKTRGGQPPPLVTSSGDGQNGRPRRLARSRQGCRQDNAVVGVSAEAGSPSTSDALANGNQPTGHNPCRCKRKGCMTCPKLTTKPEFTSNITKKTYKIINHSNEQISCHSQNLVYLLTCRHCNLQYVGESTIPLNKRMNIHRTAKTGCEHMIKHFRDSCPGAGFNIQIVEIFDGNGYSNNKVCPIAREKRITREDHWMKELRTIYPYGLNERARCHDQETPIGKLFPAIPRSVVRTFRSRENRNDHIEHHDHLSFLQDLKIHFTGDLSNLYYKIRTSLNRFKKKTLKKIASEILMKSPLIDFNSFSEQYYLFIFDIIDTKLYKPVQSKNRKQAPKHICTVNFDNKAVESIQLSRILNHPDIVSALPEGMRNKEDIPVVTYKLGSTIRNKILNYKETVDSIFVDDEVSFTLNSEPCDCLNSPFSDPHHKHIITGDLRIVHNAKLRQLLTKGPNFREPKSLNFHKALRDIRLAIDSCIDNLVTKTKHKSHVFNEWKRKIVSKVEDKIAFLKNKLTPQNTKPVLKDPDVKSYLESLHKKYVIVTIDKAANNFAFICKQFYINKLLSEVSNTSPTYLHIDKDKELIIEENKKMCEKFGLNISEKQKSLPSMYWIPKMHKNPVGARFIVASKTCSTKPLTEVISNVFKMLYKHVEGFNNKSHFYSSFKKFWVVQNSFPIIKQLDSVNAKNNAKRISTFDFSTLYTTIPHCLLIDVLSEIIEFVFKSSHRNRIGFSPTSVYWTSKGKDKRFFTKTSLIEAVTFLIKQCYFTVGNLVLKQDIGIPMGIDPAPFWANLFLYFFESKFVQSLISLGSTRAYRFHSVGRFIDDLCAINDREEFLSSYKEIYPPELELKIEHQGTHATFLDLDITIKDDIFVYKLFDKRDAFPFSIVRMPHLSSNIPSSIFYGSAFSEILRIARCTLLFSDFTPRVTELLQRMKNQGGNIKLLTKQITKAFKRYPDTFQKFGLSEDDFVAALNF